MPCPEYSSAIAVPTDPSRAAVPAHPATPRRIALARGVLLLALGLTLAACGERQPPSFAHGHWSERPDVRAQAQPHGQAPAQATSPSPASPATAAAPQTPAVAPEPARSQPRAVPSAPAAEPAPARGDTRQAALPPAARAEPPPEPPRLDELRGLNGGQLTMLLGKPSLLRQDAAAQMWQYRSESCVLYLFLYPAGSDVRVQHAETRARQTGAPAVTSGPSECLATLIGARWAQSHS